MLWCLLLQLLWKTPPYEGKNASKVWKNILQISQLIFWMLQAAKYLIYDYFYFLILLFFCPYVTPPIALGAWCNDGQILNSQDSTIKILKLWLAVCLKEINSIADVFLKLNWNENPNHEWRIRRVHHLGQCGDEIGIYIYSNFAWLYRYMVPQGRQPPVHYLLGLGQLAGLQPIQQQLNGQVHHHADSRCSPPSTWGTSCVTIYILIRSRVALSFKVCQSVRASVTPDQISTATFFNI